MPTRKVSSCFFFLMSSEFTVNRGNGWDSAATLSTFGIDFVPSTRDDAPVPATLTREESRRIGEFISAARQQDHSDRLEFIDSDATDASWAAHRATWMKWYKKLSPKVNEAIDKVLDELESLPKTMLHQQDDDTFPALVYLVSQALSSASNALFGEYACNGSFLKIEAHGAFQMLLAQTHARHKRSWKRALTILFGKVDAQGTPLQEGVGRWPKLVKDMEGS